VPLERFACGTEASETAEITKGPVWLAALSGGSDGALAVAPRRVSSKQAVAFDVGDR
jgi:hypothetical protein